MAYWRHVLESGDSMAHFSLGYSLLELGRPSEAYRHLRYYTEIAPAGAWNWVWYGKAAEAIGELTEARRAYRRAIEIEASDEGESTDAPELLAALERRRPESDAPPSAATTVIWGDEHPKLGSRCIESAGPNVALGLTAGALKKGYKHTDPNEDAVAVIQGRDATALLCADGHNGIASVRAAVEVALDRLGPAPSLATLSDETLVDLWFEAGEAVQRAAADTGQPDSRTTLVLAVVGERTLRWAAMGDSFLALVMPDGTVQRLGNPRHHFVGWPMSHDEVDKRLTRGTLQVVDGSWVILASDGLTDFAADLDAHLASTAADDPSAEVFVDQLIDSACAGGAGDNVAVVAMRAVKRLASQPLAATGRQEHGPSLPDRIRGAYFGGAVGDSLGAAVEFDSIETIRRRFGPNGVAGPVPAYGQAAPITDDTQMTLFTADGILRAHIRWTLKGICHAPTVFHHAYARWLWTQGERGTRWDPDDFDGWLIEVRGLYSRRAPGNTCLSALRGDDFGTVEKPLNDSKGCGGVMRAAPAGLLVSSRSDEPFEVGSETAAITHGHPSGYLAAGALAQTIAGAVRGEDLRGAVQGTMRQLPEARGHEEVSEALGAALALADSGMEPGPEAIAHLGEGWVADEAIAIAVYCALVARDFRHGVLLAVNHSGDSDSTGAITGNILGAVHGYGSIPTEWLEALDQRETIEALCRDWVAVFVDHIDIEGNETLWERYPGW